MIKNQFALLTKRRFLPLFVTQFLGAFNDNFYKNALAVLVVYFMTGYSSAHSSMLVTLAGGLLIVPMLLFSAQAGALAEKFEKARLIRIIKFAEILIMLLGTIGFITQNLFLLMSVVFLLGVQMTFFGPLKYSILPAHLEKDELIGGNALIEMGTFVSILLGYVLSIIFINLPHGMIIVSGVMIAVAIFGYLSSHFIPIASAPLPQLKISFNFIQETINLLRTSTKMPELFICILAISWFWLLGFVFLTLFPNYAKDIIRGDDNIYVIFLTTFSIGIACGASICNKMLKSEIKATFVPWAALGMSIFIIDLFFASQQVMHGVQPIELVTPVLYFKTFDHWRIVIDLFFITFCGGIYIVPLYSILQYRAKNEFKARIIASNNIMNALWMTIGAIATGVMLKLKFTIPQMFLMVGILNLGMVFYTYRLLLRFK